MTVEINGLELEVRTEGLIQSSGEKVLFTLENETGNLKNPVLRFFTHLNQPQPKMMNDHLYFSANGSMQRISFAWGEDPQKPLGWGGALKIPLKPKVD
jgi:hypothetical protein